MRVLAFGSVLALMVGACATDPNGAPDVTASTQLSSSAASSARAEVDPDNEIVRVRARNPAQTKRVAAVWRMLGTSIKSMVSCTMPSQQS